jgi:uncharacterized protein (DUF2132 family)
VLGQQPSFAPAILINKMFAVMNWGLVIKRSSELATRCGWHELERQIDIRCFTYDPSIASSLKFLRGTPWARVRVESPHVDILTYGNMTI